MLALGGKRVGRCLFGCLPTALSPDRGDPLKAQGAQPCKGDQTLGKLQPKGHSPTGATLNRLRAS